MSDSDTSRRLVRPAILTQTAWLIEIGAETPRSTAGEVEQEGFETTHHQEASGERGFIR